jgi:hypothetical protein
VKRGRSRIAAGILWDEWEEGEGLGLRVVIVASDGDTLTG